jgi:succinate dehydrogenase/fumarate reductase flavoprotein subunit
MDKPINNAVDELNEAGTKAASGVVTGAIKVGTNAMSAVPYFGGIISLGKIVNDVSKAAGDIAGAASDASSTISKVVEETSKNIDTGLDKLEEQKEELSSIKPEETFKQEENLKPEETFNDLKKVGGSVSNRVEKSINQFENPINSVPVLSGGRKTRRKLFKNKGKSRRVRFAI